MKYFFLTLVAKIRNNANMKNKIFEPHALVCKTLANPKRLEILYALKDGELVEKLGVTKANVSQHLALLRQAKKVKNINFMGGFIYAAQSFKGFFRNVSCIGL